ncbi:uncharacterized protein LOC131618339 [Vicia villosa]|uniref:uncharacterized protein LOC131618339 n=1 Tax=Vicia villosa TaxID=3911 RepID=UPI00273A83B4|nr:uncharacterized protein LOC131618339 [Vicia villosa]
MNKYNETNLKHLRGGSKSNHKRSLFSKKAKVTTTVVALFCLVAAFCYFPPSNNYLISGDSVRNQNPSCIDIIKHEEQEFPLRCSKRNKTEKQTCPRDYFPTKHNPTNQNSNVCPSYFRWIHEDLKPWREQGITKEMLEGARRTAHFKIAIVDGKLYVERYRKSFHTRDVFTLWSIVQLLRLYPGKIPDLELMFDCEDRPVIRSDKFQGPNASPPPLFGYCSDQSSLDIVFPDWSFWGWAEINIKPWNGILRDIKEGIKRTKWKDRVPYAYWKGNPTVAATRKDLLKCNVTSENDWKNHLYIQDWKKETHEGYKESNLGNQCTHRYKIYIEGISWSVSEKYILACDSMTLYVRPNYYDFFIRGMVPLQHYWPIRDDSKCTSLKFAVEWGNSHVDEAQAIGEAASKFMQEDLDMNNIYDYMFHLLNGYAKLLRFKPTIPVGAEELCSETMACDYKGTHRNFMEESMVMFPRDSSPCIIPPPYDSLTLQEVLERKANSTRQVEIWEDEYLLHKNNGKQ